MAFYETSAKDKTMVDDAFFALTRDIKKRLGESSGSSSTGKAAVPITVPRRTPPHPVLYSRAPAALPRLPTDNLRLPHAF